MTIDHPWPAVGVSYRRLLATLSDEVLAAELADTRRHLLAAGLEADADIVAEVIERWGP